mmetsp:Transcript_37394/g.105594  ORF Transcript_37394/g.105594 Transcript_37394/m.105594 type:complete len:166 (+) Transcript_37394:117-614(+)
MAMDATLAAVMKETINKENKFTRKWKDQRPQKASSSMAGSLTSFTASHPQSNQLNYLDQKLGIKSNPHIAANVSQDTSAEHHAQDLLRHGVSRECQGRSAYLSLKTRTLGPAERFGRQVTSAHEVGWTSSAATKKYTSSPFAHRPLIETQFFRPMGVSFSTGALP